MLKISRECSSHRIIPLSRIFYDYRLADSKIWLIFGSAGLAREWNIWLIQEKIGLNTAGSYIITMLRCLDNFESTVNNFSISVKTSTN